MTESRRSEIAAIFYRAMERRSRGVIASTDDAHDAEREANIPNSECTSAPIENDEVSQ